MIELTKIRWPSLYLLVDGILTILSAALRLAARVMMAGFAVSDFTCLHDQVCLLFTVAYSFSLL